MVSPDRIDLTASPREIGALIEGQPPSYRHLYNLAVDTRIPAEKVNGRWTLLRADLPAICTTLGLRQKRDDRATTAAMRRADLDHAARALA